MPGNRVTVPLTIQPPRDSSAEAGKHEFQLVVRSVSNISEAASVPGTLHIQPFEQFSFDAQPTELRHGRGSRVTIHNQGNQPGVFTISGSDPASALYFRGLEEPVSVEAGGEGETTVTIGAHRRGWLGTGQTRPFTLTAKSATGTKQSKGGQVKVSTIFPLWVLPLLMIMVIVCSASGVGGFAWLNRQLQVTLTADPLETAEIAASQTKEADLTIAAEEIAAGDAEGVTATALVLTDIAEGNDDTNITPTSTLERTVVNDPSPETPTTTYTPTPTRTSTPTPTPTNTPIPPTFTPTPTNTPIPPTFTPTPTNTPPPPVAVRSWKVSPIAMMALGSFLYIIENDTLYRVDPNDGSWDDLGENWPVDPIAMTALGSYLYIIENDTLYRVDPNDGSWDNLGKNWPVAPIAMTALGSYLYIIENDTLYRVDPNDGSWDNLGKNWPVDPIAMTALGSYLYVIENDTLYRVDPNDGSWDNLGKNWPVDPIAMTALGSYLYVIENDTLYRVDPNDGSWDNLGKNWPVAPIAMTAHKNSLYVIENGFLWQINPTTGSYTPLN
jgi:hypothetical protein